MKRVLVVHPEENLAHLIELLLKKGQSKQQIVNRAMLQTSNPVFLRDLERAIDEASSRLSC